MNRSLPGAMALALLLALPAAAQQQPPAAHTAIPLDPAAADRFSGYYQVGAGRAVRYWREGDHFYFGAVGTQQKTETFPETPTRFFFANPAVTFTFNTDAQGTVSLTLNQGGRDIAVPRIDEATAKGFAAPGTPPPPVPRTWPVMAGVTIHNLTSAPAKGVDYWPCFSPDGKVVLFSRSPDGQGSWALYRVAATGGAAEIFAQLPVNATRASWSAVMGRIVFNGDNANSGGIWVIDGDGRNAHAVPTPGMAAPGYPFWYPDGSIGFGDAAQNVLFRVGTAGGAATPVTHQNEVLTGMSSASPDGKWLAFAGQKNNGQIYNQGDNQIWMVDEAGKAHPVEASPGPGRTPSWSPDGKHIAFESSRGSPDGDYAIFIVNRDGSGLVQVTDYALNANHPVWSPDGKRLVFSYGSQPGKPNGIAVADLPD